MFNEPMLNDRYYGSAEGGWVYPLINANVDWPIHLGVMLSVGAAVLLVVTRRFVERWPVLVVAVWLVAGTFAQREMRGLAPFPDTDIVGSRADCFNNEARN